MQDIKKKENITFKIFLVVMAVFFVSGLIFFKKIFKEGDVFTKDMSRDNYYSTLLAQENLTSDWSPNEIVSLGNAPELSAQSAVLVDINSGKILYEKNSSKEMRIASVVKILTAVVALEHKNLNEEIFITEKAASIGENTMNITSGEVYTLEELLYGMMLNSGNDAAYAIAEGVAGSVKTFVLWMNMKAEELGMNDTKIFDPSGLDDRNYSTAIDLVKLSKYAMEKEDFRKIVSTSELTLDRSLKHKHLYLENQTNLLTTYPGVGGIKTGYTEEAGYCLVTYAKNEGVELVGVVLKSENRKIDMLFLLDYGFSNFGITVEHPLLDF
jgi:D-alanyl-D-alanine carboxypeptidase